MDERSRHRQIEDQFHRQLRTQAQKLLGRVPADRVRIQPVADGVDGVRATLARLGRYERGLLDALPGTKTEYYQFSRRVLGPFRRTVVQLRAQALAPIDTLVEGDGAGAGPVEREDVLTALARYTEMPRDARPSCVVYASATGFSADARALVHAGGSPTIVLLSARRDGGWDVELPESLKNSPWARLFELETQDELLRRLLYHLDKRGLDLETRGVTVDALAEQLGMPRPQAEALLRKACEAEPRLMTVVNDGVLTVCRSPLADEVRPMAMASWWSWFRRAVLRLPPTPAERVRQLTAQRVQLEQQRAQIDTRLNALADEARTLEERGVGAKNDAERKAIAGQLMRTERELRRTQAQANMLTQQIDVIGTHIHHQTLAEQGKRVALPSAEELARDAANAEAMMAELSTAADLASSIEVGATSALMAEEEQAIMERFKAAAAAPTPPEAAPAPQRTAQAAPAAERSRAPGAADPAADKSKARPELS